MQDDSYWYAGVVRRHLYEIAVRQCTILGQYEKDVLHCILHCNACGNKHDLARSGNMQGGSYPIDI